MWKPTDDRIRRVESLVLGNAVDLTLSLDSYATAVQPQIAQFNGGNVLGFFSGSNLEATIESSEQGADEQRIWIRGFRPVTDASSVFGSLSYRDTQQEASIDSAEVAINTRTGRCDIRRDARYSRFRVRIPSGTTWTFAAGVVPDVAAGGML
jgi:hypothetical protein